MNVSCLGELIPPAFLRKQEGGISSDDPDVISTFLFLRDVLSYEPITYGTTVNVSYKRELIPAALFRFASQSETAGISSDDPDVISTFLFLRDVLTYIIIALNRFFSLKVNF